MAPCTRTNDLTGAYTDQARVLAEISTWRNGQYYGPLGKNSRNPARSACFKSGGEAVQVGIAVEIVRYPFIPPMGFARFDRDRRPRVLYSGNSENIRSQERGEAMPGAETSWKQLGHWAEARARSQTPCSPRAGRLGSSRLQVTARLSPGSERPTRLPDPPVRPQAPPPGSPLTLRTVSP
ncbi:uncharacterized protein CC84DRAFT_492443 [Paraphaeosphaeria sporulosa]|uniref:Uncharacterized protein n=1 Tax=Paraphaeosphaeria sporulosa TaxID=1460663 RepID=A0A177CT62_9PLEO|nr:uncharacterized protein CC84DRAFT_492443 [Paraphaeosphaeria sporulosa]OAG10724.1 hypothetical protein CC84DRAFT_492443 [Paraphaeosphaeria sporulosa]